MKSKGTDSSSRVNADIKVKVLPRSSNNRITGKEGEVFKVKLTAPPVDGRANEALIELLSKRLRTAKGNLEIISGKRARLKSVRVHGMSAQEVASILEPQIRAGADQGV